MLPVRSKHNPTRQEDSSEQQSLAERENSPEQEPPHRRMRVDVALPDEAAESTAAAEPETVTTMKAAAAKPAVVLDDRIPKDKKTKEPLYYPVIIGEYCGHSLNKKTATELYAQPGRHHCPYQDCGCRDYLSPRQIVGGGVDFPLNLALQQKTMNLLQQQYPIEYCFYTIKLVVENRNRDFSDIFNTLQWFIEHGINPNSIFSPPFSMLLDELTRHLDINGNSFMHYLVAKIEFPQGKTIADFLQCFNKQQLLFMLRQKNTHGLNPLEMLYALFNDPNKSPEQRKAYQISLDLFCRFINPMFPSPIPQEKILSRMSLPPLPNSVEVPAKPDKAEQKSTELSDYETDHVSLGLLEEPVTLSCGHEVNMDTAKDIRKREEQEAQQQGRPMQLHCPICRQPVSSNFGVDSIMQQSITNGLKEKSLAKHHLSVLKLHGHIGIDAHVNYNICNSLLCLCQLKEEQLEPTPDVLEALAELPPILEALSKHVDRIINGRSILHYLLSKKDLTSDFLTNVLSWFNASQILTMSQQRYKNSDRKMLTPFGMLLYRFSEGRNPRNFDIVCEYLNHTLLPKLSLEEKNSMFMFLLTIPIGYIDKLEEPHKTELLKAHIVDCITPYKRMPGAKIDKHKIQDLAQYTKNYRNCAGFRRVLNTRHQLDDYQIIESIIPVFTGMFIEVEGIKILQNLLRVPRYFTYGIIKEIATIRNGFSVTGQELYDLFLDALPNKAALASLETFFSIILLLNNQLPAELIHWLNIKLSNSQISFDAQRMQNLFDNLIQSHQSSLDGSATTKTQAIKEEEIPKMRFELFLQETLVATAEAAIADQDFVETPDDAIEFVALQPQPQQAQQPQPQQPPFKSALFKQPQHQPQPQRQLPPQPRLQPQSSRYLQSETIIKP